MPSTCEDHYCLSSSQESFEEKLIDKPYGEILDTENERTEHAKVHKSIAVGDFLPYGPRMYYETTENVVRMKDIGTKHRILVLGVIGSFTPYCWNRHLFRVLGKLEYFEDREVDYICCISTNDAYTQKAWGVYLGCEETVLMWADTTKRFTKAIGMDTVIPWLDDTIRSKRYIILADDMKVIKMTTAPFDDTQLEWQCEHLGLSRKTTGKNDKLEIT